MHCMFPFPLYVLDEDIFSSWSAYQDAKISSSESSESEEEHSGSDFEMEVKQIFHGVTESIRPPIHG